VSTKCAQICQRLSSLVADAGAAMESQPIAAR